MSAIRTGLNGLAVRIPIAAAQERFSRINLAERTTQNFDNRARMSCDVRATRQRLSDQLVSEPEATSGSLRTSFC